MKMKKEKIKLYDTVAILKDIPEKKWFLGKWVPSLKNWLRVYSKWSLQISLGKPLLSLP